MVDTERSSLFQPKVFINLHLMVAIIVPTKGIYKAPFNGGNRAVIIVPTKGIYDDLVNGGYRAVIIFPAKGNNKAPVNGGYRPVIIVHQFYTVL